MFSVLTPGTHILPHRGVTNTRVVCHLPLVVPEDCALVVGGETHVWREGEAVAFDDTYEHEAWNRGSRTRVVLIVDVWNPHLTAAERDALATLAGAMGEFNKAAGLMSAKIIDGKRIAEEFRREVRAGTDALERSAGRRPGLAVVMVGDNAASAVYVRNKRRACEETGIVSVAHDLPASTSEAELLALIDRLNADPAIDGILVQLPLPAHVASVAVLERIDPAKDVDGFHPYNVGPARAAHADPAALHALRDHADAGTRRPRSARQERRHRRPEQHRRPADGARAAHESRDHHRLPQPDRATSSGRSARRRSSSPRSGSPSSCRAPGSGRARS